jgi:arylsulfatase A-like enzyme
MDSIADAIEEIIAAFGTRPYVIVIMPDNGNFMGEHRIYDGKGQHYEEASEVPLFIFGNGISATQTDALVYQADIAPTVADLVGVAKPSGLDGRSLVPLMANPALAWRERVLLHERYTGLRTKRRKYVEWNNGECEWYNLVLDPYELQNRCSPGCACGDTMRANVEELANCRADGCWTAETRP